MAYQTRTFNSINQIPVADWDRIAGRRSFAKHRWFRFLEEADQGFRPRYILVYENGAALAGAAYVLHRHEEIPVGQPVRAILERYLQRWPLLSCQTHLLGRSALLLPEGTDGEGTARSLVQATCQLAIQEKCSFIVYDFLPDGRELAILRRIGLRDCLYPSEEGTYLPITWTSFEGYLASLDHKRRQDLRRNMRRAADAGVRVEATRDLLAERPRVCELIANVYRRHNEQRMPAAEAFCESARAHVADHVLLLLAYKGSQVAGCGFLLQDEGEILLRVLGLDYELDDRGHVYRHLWHAAIRQAIESGAHRLDGGSTAYAFKQRLGFQLEQTSVAFTATGPLLRQVGNWIARLL